MSYSPYILDLVMMFGLVLGVWIGIMLSYLLIVIHNKREYEKSLSDHDYKIYKECERFFK
jgi:MFS superfamily sulfate permease-like transporter